MKKIINFIKRHKFISLVGAAIIVSTIYLVTTSKQKKELPTQTPDSKESPTQTPNGAKEGISYNSITPGISTEEVVTEQLGEPLSIDWKGPRKTLEYKSTSQTRRHQVVLEENQVIFIKEIVSINDDKKAQDLIQKYGNPTSVLYNRSYPEDTFSLYVYEERGLAYLGHQDGTLLEIWYFSPTSIDEFINKWAPGYSLEKPPQEPVQTSY